MKKMIFFITTISLVTLVVLNVDKTLTSDKHVLLKNIEALAADPESNNDGSGKFYYKHLLGQPKSCTKYKHVKADGTIKYSNDEANLGAEWTTSTVDGLKELCPNKGSGCTAYSCTSTGE